MYVILGATGHVGSAVAMNLLKGGRDVTVVTRNPERAKHLSHIGAKVACVDVHNTEELANVLKTSRRAFLINPPANPGLNCDLEERATINSIIDALRMAKLEKIVVQSTYGVREATCCGDLGTLYDFEQGVRNSGVPSCIIRAAYYMSNWISLVPEVVKSGKLLTLLPSDLAVPMVAPEDIGYLAANLLSSATDEVGVYNVEGPRYYSAKDVASCIGKSLNKDVYVEEIPKDLWKDFYLKNGFSKESADSYANMTETFIEELYDVPQNPLKGATSLQKYISEHVRNGI